MTHRSALHPARAALLVGLLWAAFAGTASAASPATIDPCQYPDQAAAQAAWVPMGKTAPVTLADLEGHQVLLLPCNFAGTKLERASWDRAVTLDLSGCQGIQFQLLCREAGPISHFSLYFQSGAGWYHAAFYPESSTGWNTIQIDKAHTSTEGKPAGWGQITALRLSAWRGRDAGTEFFVRNLRKLGVLGEDATVAILRAESAARNQPGEARAVEQFTETVAEILRALNIGCAVVSDLDVTAAQLQPARLVILPHNPGLPDRVAGELVKHAAAGGKLLAFYTVSEKLFPVLHVTGGRHVPAPRPGAFSSIRFAGPSLPGAPTNVGQQSWNISALQPIPNASRTFGEWLDDAGQPTGYPAVIGSTNGLVMTHVLLPDDATHKRQMLLAMVGYLVPEVWSRAAQASVDRIGSLGGYGSFEEASNQIARLPGHPLAVTQALASATSLRDSARELMAQQRFPEAMDQAELARRKTQEAFCLGQQGLPGEFRAFWCHSAFGVQGLNWDEAIHRLADNGFTAILPNMLWGGAAFYPSKLLPVAQPVPQRGDQIAQCLAACRRYGVQMHVWKVNWNLGSAAPKEFVDKMRTANRLQHDVHGVEEPWLCPSHPANQALEIASMVEVARQYDVDGLHFDYIRYPDANHCFCPGCRERFQRAVRGALKNWPKDVLAEGPLHRSWLDWRRGNITAVVKAVSQQARALKPKIKISAAVFPNWSTDRDSVGQDWKLWCERGYVDFVCPMDYTPSNRGFESMVAQQVQWAGRVPCYPGLGVSASSSHFGADRAIEQILVTRQHHTGGFTIFNYGVSECKDLLPLLGLGITAKQ